MQKNWDTEREKIINKLNDPRAYTSKLEWSVRIIGLIIIAVIVYYSGMKDWY